MAKLIPEEICHCVLAKAETGEHERPIASSVGMAIPKDGSRWGYLSEVRSCGMNSKEAADMAEDLAAEMLGTTMRLEINPDRTWSEKEFGW